MRGAELVRVEDMSALLAYVAGAESAHRDSVPDIDLAAARLAGELKHQSRRLVGLLPAATADVARTATELALALGTMTETLVLVLLPQATHDDVEPGDVAPRVRWIGPSAAAVSPATVAAVGEKGAGIAAMLDFLATRADSYGHVLIDLTGCEQPGELLSTLALLDGVIVVGKAGRVSEPALRRATKAVPQHLRVGVLLHE